MLRIDRMSRRASSSRALLIALVAIAFIAANAYSYAQRPGGRGQGRQGGQNGNWGGRGQGGQGGRGGQNGAWGGRGQDGQNPFSAEQISQRMTRDGFERLRSNPAWADRVKGIVGEDRWAQWERGDFSSGASAAAQAAAAAEGRPVDGNLSDAERAEAEALLRTGSVPDFRNPDQPYSLEAENAYYQRALAQRDDSLVSSVPLSIRTYSRFFVTKYDKNGDGMLQRAEWEDKVNGAQAIDIDGDWTLTDQEIMYYLARFSQGRTLSNPNPSQTPTPRVNAVVEATETPLLIRTASAAPRRMTRSEFDEEREQLLQGDLAELSDEDFIKLMTEDNPALESVEDEELLGVLLADMDESNYREYTTPPQVMVGVPVWFLARDVNGDGQLTLLEFAPSLLPSAVAQFGKFDANADGLITAEEIREAQKKAKPAE